MGVAQSGPLVSDNENLLEGFQLTRLTLLGGAVALVIGIAPAETRAQQQQGPRRLVVGNRLGLPVEPAADKPFEAISTNVKVHGAIYSAESCSYDAERGVIVVPNRGVPLVIMKDGTKYVSSVLNGGVSRIRTGKAVELIARNIPSAASMCYDAGANQLVIPMNANNGLAFIRIE